MLEDHIGRLWVGVDNGLYLFHEGRFTSIPNADGKPVGLVSGMTEDSNHDIWVQASRIRFRQLIRISHDKVLEVHTPPEVPPSYSVYSGVDGSLWLNPIAGGLSRYKGGNLDTALLDHSAYLGPIRSLFLDPDGSVWGSARLGLVAWRNGRLELLSERNGLPCAMINSVSEDASGALWLYAQCGLIKIERPEIERWWKAPSVKISSQVFDRSSGAQPANSSFLPAAARSLDGRLWFVNDSVLQMIDPNHLDTNALAPPVHIQQLVADHKDISPTPDIRLPPLTKDLEIDYTALSFVMPQRVRFRYKLEGHDGQWQDGNTRRATFYTNLEPGTYRFLITACNDRGVWNNDGAALSFLILPAWYQTVWFRLLSILFVALLCYTFYLLKLRQYATTMRVRFNERLDERTQIARNLHDTLLQTIQGSKLVADHAKNDLSDVAKTENYLNTLSEWLERASIEGRTALESLRAGTTETNNLAEAILALIEDLKTKSDVTISMSVRGAPREMHPVVRQEVCLIAHEAIGNACRHSGGRSIRISLAYDHDVTLRVQDDGRGIDTTILNAGRPGHFGLLGMNERASRIGATLIISASQGVGTEVTLLVPGNVVFKPNDNLIDSWAQKFMNLFRPPPS